MTFCATVNAVIHSGATPVLADVDAATFNLDAENILRKLTHRTKAIIPVHFAGRACRMDDIMAIARQRNLKVIEDCAHAIETDHRGQRVGSFGDCGVLSFYSTKNVVTGEGGMVLTRNPDFATRIKVLALHGMSEDAWKRFSDDGYKHYEVIETGFKYNMMDLQAAIGLHQIQRVDTYWSRRQQIWHRYDEAFSDLPVTRPAACDSESRHGLHLYTLLIDEARAGVTRDQFMLALHRQRVGTGVHYRPVHAHPVYQQRFGWRAGDFPNAEAIGHTTVSIPLSAKLTDDDVEDVIAVVRDVLTGSR